MDDISKDNISGRIIARRKELGIESQGELARLVGVSRTSISHWESGETEPTGENLIKLANVLKLSPEKVQSGKEKVIDQVIIVKVDPNSIMSPIPLLESSNQIESWLGCPMLTMSHKLMPPPPDIKISKETFAYRVLGNSMVHPYDQDLSVLPGEIVFVDPQEITTLESGELVLVKFGPDDYRIRQYQQDGKNIWLKVFDQSIPPTLFTEDIQLIGVIVSATKNKRKNKKSSLANKG